MKLFLVLLLVVLVFAKPDVTSSVVIDPFSTHILTLGDVRKISFSAIDSEGNDVSLAFKGDTQTYHICLRQNRCDLYEMYPPRSDNYHIVLINDHPFSQKIEYKYKYNIYGSDVIICITFGLLLCFFMATIFTRKD